MDQNFAQAYLLYMRYLTLLMDYLPSHPESKQPEMKKALSRINKSLPGVATDLEKIKPIVQSEHDAWQSTARQKESQKKQSGDAHSQPGPTQDGHTTVDPALSSAGRLLDAGENQELAVKLAQRELQRRDRNTTASRAAGISTEEEKARRNAGFWDNLPEDLAERQAEDEEIFRMQMELTRRRLDRADGGHEGGRKHGFEPEGPPPWSEQPPRSSKYQYPAITRSKPVQYEARQSDPTTAPITKPITQQPPRPPKEGIRQPQQINTSTRPTLTPIPPAVPASVPIPTSPPAPVPAIVSTPPPVPNISSPERPAKRPAPDEEETLPTAGTSQGLPAVPPKDPIEPPKKQQRTAFKPAAHAENGDPLRPLFMPRRLRREFLATVAPNTNNDIETCGLLGGTLVNNALFVTHVVIPEQIGTSDLCETTNDSALFDAFIDNDIVTLGWIHTHPQQTCFMSSRDCHTGSGYQLQTAEAVSIVCAPTDRVSP